MKKLLEKEGMLHFQEENLGWIFDGKTFKIILQGTC